MTKLFSIIGLLAKRHALSHEAYRALVEGQTPDCLATDLKFIETLLLLVSVKHLRDWGTLIQDQGVVSVL